MNEMVKNLLLWVVIAVVLVTVVQSFKLGGAASNEVPYSDFMQQIANGNVSEVLIHNDMKTVEPSRYTSNSTLCSLSRVALPNESTFGVGLRLISTITSSSSRGESCRNF